MMKRIIYISLAIPFVVAAIAGCSEFGGMNLNDLEITPEEKFSSTIHFVSKFNDAAMGSTVSDYSSVDTYFTTTLNKKAGSWLGVIERSDVVYGTGQMFNPGINIAHDADRWTFFALQKITNKTTHEGATILFNKYTTSITSTELGSGSRVYGFAPTMDGTRTDEDGTVNEISLPIEYRYARINEAANITALGGENGVLNKLKDQARNFLLVGSIRSTLASSLESTVQDADDNFRCEFIETGSDYSIFLLYEKRFWEMRSYESVSLGNGITAYEINMMW